MDGFSKFGYSYFSFEIGSTVCRYGLKTLPDLIVVTRIDIDIIEPVEILGEYVCDPVGGQRSLFLR